MRRLTDPPLTTAWNAKKWNNGNLWSTDSERESHLERRFRDDVLSESDVRGASRFQGDGVQAEVFQHVEDGLEPEVLDPALSLAADRQAQVLRERNGKTFCH